MISPVMAITIVAFLFYLMIPGVGAFDVRRRWRVFRRRVTEASLRPPVTFALSRRSSHDHETPLAARFLGTLESIQGEHTVWIRGSDITVAVDMSVSDVYLVAHSPDSPPEAPPARTSWARLGSIPEGMKVLVSGHLDSSGSHPVIRSCANEPVLAVFYDGLESSLVRRCIWSGRQLNEYWNSATPPALAGGTFALIVLAYVLLRQPLALSYARLAIAFATVPVLPLLPPGIALFYLYRVGWRRGRVLRAHRDVIQLPLRYLADGVQCASLPNGELYCMTDHPVAAIGELRRNGLTVIDPPFGHRSDSCAVFGRAAAGGLAPPSDALCEWTAVLGDPRLASVECQRMARRYELGSVLTLSVGLLMNLLLVMAVLVLVL